MRLKEHHLVCRPKNRPFCRVLFLGYVLAHSIEGSGIGQITTPNGVTAISAEGLIQEPGHYFDLEGKTLRFTPKSEGYIVQSLPLDYRTNLGVFLNFQNQARVTLPFSFPFGGKSWTEIFVNLNGNVSFGRPEVEFLPFRDRWPRATVQSVAAALDVRSNGGSELVIAPLWSLYGVVTGGVFANSSDQMCMVTWELMRSQAPGAPWNDSPPGFNVFQARLFPNGVIEFAYKQVSERDGIVGLFPGRNPDGATLDHVDDEGDVDPEIDIVSADVVDAGSTVKFRVTMASEPSAISYRVRLDVGGMQCQLGVVLNSASTAWSDCSFALPAAGGVEVVGKTVTLYLSKVALRKANQFFWVLDVESKRTGRVDFVRADGLGRFVGMSQVISGQLDLSGPLAESRGNLFEVFHYPVLLKDIRQTVRYVYRRFFPSDDVALVFTDFRIDELYPTAESTSGLNIPIQGIGRLSGSGEAFGSSRLQVSMSPIYLGAPLFAETATLSGSQYREYPFAVGLIAHEVGHRWGAHLGFKNPLNGRTETLLAPDGCNCHWDDYLNTPSAYSVAQIYSSGLYAENSPMGGARWVDNGDGTFTRQRSSFWFPSGFSTLDLYAMGVVGPMEVPETFILRDVSLLSANLVRASKVPVRIEDIVAVMGPRSPSSPSSQKIFKLGIYLLHEPGRQPDPDVLVRAQGVSSSLTKYFAAATGDRMQLTQQKVNAPPRALPMTVSARKGVAVDIILNGFDPDSDPLKFFLLSQPRQGVLEGTAPNLKYVSGSDFTGADSFEFRVSDGTLDSAAATVTIDSAMFSWILPSSARAPGRGGAFYTTDLTVANTSDQGANFIMKFLGHNSDGGYGFEQLFWIPPRSTRTYFDVLKSAFNVESGYGAIKILSSSPSLSFMTQTSTPGAGGTFGQSVPVLAPDDLVQDDLPRIITGIREDDFFRTNLILCSAKVNSPIEVFLSLFDESGLLAERKVSLLPLEMIQLARVVTELGVSTDVRNAHLIVASSGGPLAAYAAVIDNVTNDPRTILSIRILTSPRVQFLPSSARVTGAGGAFYTTDLSVTNTLPKAVNFTIKFLGNNKDGRSGPEREFTIQGGRSMVFQDVLGSVFGLSEDYGALRIAASEAGLAVLGQTWTPGAGGTFGQSVPAMSSANFIAQGSGRSILGIREDGAFRTNLILANSTETPVSVHVELVAENGQVLGTKKYELQPLGMTQVTRVMRDLGVGGDVSGARLLLNTSTPAGAFAAYASVIDNVTNDPRTLLPR
jgi:hypothetical protein